MRSVEPGDGELTTRGDQIVWNVTRHVATSLSATTTERLLLVLAADSCPGCDTLSEQLLEHGDILGSATDIIKAVGGDLERGAVPLGLTIGHVTVTGPGVPMGLLFDVAAPGKLDFRALLLGPLHAGEPARTLADLLVGRSHWVPEASGAKIQVCIDGLCLPLHASNRFHSPFSAILGGPQEP